MDSEILYFLICSLCIKHLVHHYILVFSLVHFMKFVKMFHLECTTVLSDYNLHAVSCRKISVYTLFTCQILHSLCNFEGTWLVEFVEWLSPVWRMHY